MTPTPEQSDVDKRTRDLQESIEMSRSEEKRMKIIRESLDTIEDQENRDRKENETNEDIICPFCGEKDFDLIGLKYHLKWYCEVFNNTEDIRDPLYQGR